MFFLPLLLYLYRLKLYFCKENFFLLRLVSTFSLKKKRRQQRAGIELKEGTQVAAGWLSSAAAACMNNKPRARRTRGPRAPWPLHGIRS
jgi:hypothetical protein